MAAFGLFKLEKLKILVFTKADRLQAVGKPLEVMFNPETYSINYKNNFSVEQGIGTGGKESEFDKSPPSSIEFKFVIDGTGVSEYGAVNGSKGKKDVYKAVQDFLTATTTINGSIHEPNYLRIEWGDLLFDCRLNTVKVSYTLFDQSGKPLRAELNTTFFGDVKTSKRLKKESRTSPDLTHKRVVKASDTLPLMCEEIYGSESYYLKVALANNLNDFRNLKPGQELFFPPVEK
jgi:hypothetical protein